MAYGELGPTHHSIEDIAWLRAIDNMIIIVPADPIETARPCAGRRRPTARRSSGSAGWACRRSTPTTTQFVPGKAITAARRRRRDLDQQRHRALAALVAAERLPTKVSRPA